MFLKISSIPLVNWLWSFFFLLLLAQFLWDLFRAYPVAFERQLRNGKTWVYIPLKWKGSYKVVSVSVSRLLLLGLGIVSTALFTYYTRWHEPAWIRVMIAIVFLILASRLGTFWTGIRYHQQEDAYYLLHDELRLKLDREGKDYTEAQFRNLAAYQHQQRLRKSDESGQLLSSLRREARLAHQVPPSLEPVEN